MWTNSYLAVRNAALVPGPTVKALGATTCNAETWLMLSRASIPVARPLYHDAIARGLTPWGDPSGFYPAKWLVLMIPKLSAPVLVASERLQLTPQTFALNLLAELLSANPGGTRTERWVYS